jgi:4-hydroxy-tetrahydrodipicolinate synthase
MPGVVLTSVPVPFTSDGELDTSVARRLMEFAASRTDGLMVAGSTGEFPALTDSERLTLFELALSIAGADRVIAHVGAPSARQATRLAAAAQKAGARNTAAVTPYYNAVTPAELREYYRSIRDAVPDASLFAYIFPERTGRAVPVEEFAALTADAGLAGVKLSGSAYASLADCVKACPAAKVYAGSDQDLAGVLSAGGAGVISARAAAYPEAFAGLAAALAADDDVAVAGWQSFIAELVALGASIGRVKAALRLRGFGEMGARMPLDWPSDEVSARIAVLVGKLTDSSLITDRKQRDSS